MKVKTIAISTMQDELYRAMCPYVIGNDEGTLIGSDIAKSMENMRDYPSYLDEIIGLVQSNSWTTIIVHRTSVFTAYVERSTKERTIRHRVEAFVNSLLYENVDTIGFYILWRRNDSASREINSSTINDLLWRFQTNGCGSDFVSWADFIVGGHIPMTHGSQSTSIWDSIMSEQGNVLFRFITMALALSGLDVRHHNAFDSGCVRCGWGDSDIERALEVVYGLNGVAGSVED